MNDLTGFQRDLLFVCAGHDHPSGQDIKVHIEEYLGGEVNNGRLYPNLDILVEADLVEKGTLDQRTNYYELTEKGRSAIRQRWAWERRQHGHASDVRSDNTVGSSAD